MKRELFQNVTAIPYNSGDVIDRTGFLSAVIGASVQAGTEVKVTVEHSDDGSEFVPVTDPMVFPEKPTKDGELTTKNEAEKAAEVNIDVDLGGLKHFVKFTVTGADALAVVLGDSNAQPV